MDFWIEPCTILVTGCNRGIGLEFVKQMLVKWPNSKIYATIRDASKATPDTELGKLVQSSKMLSVKSLDITDEKSIKKLANELSPELGPSGLCLLINNAGIMHRPQNADILKQSDDLSAELLAFEIPASIVSESSDSFLSVFRTNVVGTFNMTKHFLPLLNRCADHCSAGYPCGSPLIVNVSSLMGSIGGNKGGSYYSYRASKSALNMVTKSLSIDLKPLNIGCLTVHPGWVQTDMGGPQAVVTPQDSVSGLLSVIDSYEPELTGKYYSFTGQELDW